MQIKVESITRASSDYPSNIEIALGEASPDEIYTIGTIANLSNQKLAVFCSSKCPGRLILKIYDFAEKFRAEGRTIISGFHSSMEKECLSILLRSANPIIICPARGLDSMRIPSQWKTPISDGRLLIISRFEGKIKKATISLAKQRNEFVAALADTILITHATAGGKLFQLAKTIRSWGKKMYTLNDEANENLIKIGANPFN